MTNLPIFSPNFLIFDKVFDEFWRDFPISRQLPQSGFPIVEHWVDDSGNAVVQFVVAGYGAEDLNISVEGSKLTVSSEGVDDEEVKGGLRRFTRKAFSRSLTDGDNVYDLNKLQANLDKGILRIEIPKKESAKPKVFTIQESIKKLSE